MSAGFKFRGFHGFKADQKLGIEGSLHEAKSSPQEATQGS